MPKRAAKPVRAPAALTSHLGFWLRFVSNHVSGEFRKAIEARGVQVSEWVALRELYEDGAITAARLMTTLGMTKGAISKLLTRLEAKGLVERLASDTDARVQNLALTAAGRQLVPQLAALADRNDEHFFGHLSAAQRQTLDTLLQDLVRVHNLRQLPLE